MEKELEIVCKKCGKKLAVIEMRSQGETIILKGRTDLECIASSNGVMWTFKCTDNRCELSKGEAAKYILGTLRNNLKINV